MMASNDPIVNDDGYHSPLEHRDAETLGIRNAESSPDPANYGATKDEETPVTDAAQDVSRGWWPKCIPDWFVDEFRKLASLSWSMFLLAVFSYLIGPVSLAFCGHLGTKTMDGVALALTVINVTGISIAMGLAMACGTFFAQCYGSVNRGRVGLYLLRSLIILLLFILPCWAIHLNAESLLLKFHQEKEVARIAGEYIAYFMPAMPGVFVMEILMQYLRCQNIILPTIVIGGTGVLVNAVMHGLLLFVGGMGSNGSALAQVVTFNFMALSLIAYILYNGVYKETWEGWKLREVFEDWGVFLKLAVSGMLMLGMEWWTFEIATLISGVFDPVSLGAQSIGFQLLSIVYMVPLGISLASTIRVGHLLGAEDHKQVARAVKVAFALAAFCECVVGLGLVAFHTLLPEIFTNNPAIIDYAGYIVLLVALYEVFDSIACVSAGILRGCGQQVAGAVVTFVGFYIIALPISMTLMLGTPLELSGYYTGLIIGMSIVVCVFCFFIWNINWEKEVEKARIRTGTDQIAMEVLGPVQELTRRERVNSILSRRSAVRGRTYSISSEWYEDYMGNYGSQQDLIYDPSESTHKKLDKKTIKLVVTRVGFVLFMVLTFAVGLVFRIVSEAHGHDSANGTAISTLGTPTLGPFMSNSTTALYSLPTSWFTDSTTE